MGQVPTIEQGADLSTWLFLGGLAGATAAVLVLYARAIRGWVVPEPRTDLATPEHFVRMRGRDHGIDMGRGWRSGDDPGAAWHLWWTEANGEIVGLRYAAQPPPPGPAYFNPVHGRTVLDPVGVHHFTGMRVLGWADRPPPHGVCERLRARPDGLDVLTGAPGRRCPCSPARTPTTVRRPRPTRPDRRPPGPARASAPTADRAGQTGGRRREVPMGGLEAVPEDWERGLAVVAHPDDLEYGAASAIARWTGQGKHITYLLVTSGEAGIDSMDPDRCAVVRQEDERRSAAVVGVDAVEFLAHPDGLVEHGIPLRRDLAAAIRRHRPEVLISINFRDRWPAGFNHADHRAVGLALIDAARDAGNRWLFPGAGGEPWSGARFALFAGSSEATHAVDITETLEAGIESLRAHQGYLDALPEGTVGKDPEPFLRGMAEAAGPALGVDAAVTFELVPL